MGLAVKLCPADLVSILIGPPHVQWRMLDIGEVQLLKGSQYTVDHEYGDLQNPGFVHSLIPNTTNSTIISVWM